MVGKLKWSSFKLKQVLALHVFEAASNCTHSFTPCQQRKKTTKQSQQSKQTTKQKKINKNI